MRLTEYDLQETGLTYDKDPIGIAETKLKETDEDYIEIPKSLLDELPDRFEQHAPANELTEEGALHSYRDDQEEDSVHIIEYDDYWRAHIDSKNPRFRKIEHLTEDALKTTAIATAFVLLFVYKNYWD